MTIEVEGKPAPPLSDADAEAKLAEVCKLSELKYQRERSELATELNITVGALDKLRHQQSATSTSEDDCNDELVNGVVPWPEPVDGDALAAEVQALLNRYCVLQQHTDVTTTVWVIAHYCIEHTRIFPKLLIKSPQKRCGKSTLLETLEAVCNRAMIASNVSAAVIFRVIESYNCTLLLDEADTWIHNNEELRGIINSGNTRSSAYVWRVEGDNHEPKRFSTFAPMIIAMIGEPPDTIADRSAHVGLRRKLTSESVERMPIDLKVKTLDLRRKLQKWADDNGSNIVGASPAMPAIDNDRALDNYTPLAAVADLLGGEWPGMLKQAIESLGSVSDDDSDDITVELLKDIQLAFQNPQRDFLHSSDLVSRLIVMADRPWCEITNGKPLTQHKLAKLLKPFNIKPGQLNKSDGNKRGYYSAQFKDALERYVPAIVSEQSEVSAVSEIMATESHSVTSLQNSTALASEVENQSEVKKTQQKAITADTSLTSLSQSGLDKAVDF